MPTVYYSAPAAKLTNKVITIPQQSIAAGYDYMTIQATMTTAQLQTAGWTIVLSVDVSFDNGVTWENQSDTINGGPQQVGRLGNPPPSPGLALDFGKKACLVQGTIQVTGTVTAGALVQTYP